MAVHGYLISLFKRKQQQQPQQKSRFQNLIFSTYRPFQLERLVQYGFPIPHFSLFETVSYLVKRTLINQGLLLLTEIGAFFSLLLVIDVQNRGLSQIQQLIHVDKSFQT